MWGPGNIQSTTGEAGGRENVSRETGQGGGEGPSALCLVSVLWGAVWTGNQALPAIPWASLDTTLKQGSPGREELRARKDASHHEHPWETAHPIVSPSHCWDTSSISPPYTSLLPGYPCPESLSLELPISGSCLTPLSRQKQGPRALVTHSDMCVLATLHPAQCGVISNLF